MDDPPAAQRLSNEQWQLVAHLVDSTGSRGGRHPTHPRRQILEAVLHVLTTECPWRDLPSQFPPWRTVYGYHCQWSADGTLLKVRTALAEAVPAD